MRAEKERRRRLFFALWPTAAMQEALAAAASRSIESLRSGRPVPTANLHLTLAFLGSIAESSLQAVEELAQRVALEGSAQRVPLEGSARPVPREGSARPVPREGSARPVPRASAARGAHRPPGLTITFDALEYWARAEILCAAGRRAPVEGAHVAGALKQALLARGFAPDLKPFRPHVTLARQVRRGPNERALPEVSWTFSEFALIESRSSPAGSLYSVVASWPLYGAA